jgi:hypothetical protein
MKFKVTMKDPDALCDAIDDCPEIKASIPDGLDDDEREEVFSRRKTKAREFAGRWMDYGEYITVEFDTDAGTATIVPTE